MKAPITGTTNKIDHGIGRKTGRRLFAADTLVLPSRRSETRARHRAVMLSGDATDDEWEHFLCADKPVKAWPGN